jgi:soluble lytic murein transglycosylase-like protein
MTTLAAQRENGLIDTRGIERKAALPMRRNRRKSSLPSLLAATALLAFAGVALAAGKSPDPPPENRYRLNTANPEAFRLAKPGNASSARPAIAAALAGKPYAEQIDRAARATSLDPALVHAVIHVESRYNPAARSPKGALGLMQVLPETAARYGVTDVTRSVTVNLGVGTRYLRDLLDLFGDRVDLALAAYNAGEQAVLRHGERIPPYRETQAYVPAVLEKYREWREPPPAVRPRIQYLPGTVLDPAATPGMRPD